MSVGANIVIFLVIVIVLLIAYYFYRQWSTSKNSQAQAKVPFPPTNYMQYVGQKCPDYWVYQGTTSNGEFQCKNSYNLPVANPNSQYCYSESDGSIRTFSPLNKWPPSSTDSALTDRCNWIKNCGPAANIPGSWVGINALC